MINIHKGLFIFSNDSTADIKAIGDLSCENNLQLFLFTHRMS